MSARPSLRSIGQDAGTSSLATAVGNLAARGCRKLLVTSSAAGEGTSYVVSEAGRALAAGSRDSVLLLDADPLNPSLRRAFGLHSRRGVTELIDEVYLLDPTREDPLQFGLGDWFSMLRAQRRSGDLEVKEEGRTWSVRVVKGSIHSVTSPPELGGRRLGELLVAHGRLTAAQVEEVSRIHQESGRPFGDVARALGWTDAEGLRLALSDQVRERLTGLIALRMPECRFVELVEAYRPASGGRSAAPSDGLFDELVFGSMHEYFKRPYLASQIPSYFSDTDVPNLKVLTAGQRGGDLQAPGHREAFALLLDHLARIFDVVLIDAHPVTRGGATTALATLTDGVLLVVRSNATEAPAVREAVEELRRGAANVLGLVLNEVGEEEISNEIPWEVLSHGDANPA
jgi:Mrp family chromosome partitioning ATPase